MQERVGSLNYCMGPVEQGKAKRAELATSDLFTRPVQIVEVFVHLKERRFQKLG